MQFASFSYPRKAFTLPTAPLQKRLADFKAYHGPGPCGPYFQSEPKPIKRGDRGVFFYLDSDFQPGLRWQYADDVIRLNHKGWFCDDFQDQTIRGIVMALPHGRGFLPGWTMGEGMASSLDCDIYADKAEAARAADRLAEITAEREREYQAEQTAEREAEEEREAMLATAEQDQSGEH